MRVFGAAASRCGLSSSADDASAGISERQITWARLFHIRPETYKAALAAIINAHLAHPFAKLWGNGTTSSSDGQFFRSAGRGAKRGDVNAHYSGDPGSKFYTWVSDQGLASARP